MKKEVNKMDKQMKNSVEVIKKVSHNTILNIILIIIGIIFLVVIIIGGVWLYLDKSKTTPDWLDSTIKETRNCETLGSEEQDSCYQNMALSELDASYCEKIQIENTFVSKDVCYNLLAAKTKNKLLCDKIQNQYLKENCLEIV